MIWLYMRVFAVRSFRMWAWPLMALCSGYGIAFLIAFVTNCHPVSQQWDPVPWGSCRDIVKTQLSSNIINTFLDFAVVFLPMPYVYGLRMPLHKRLAVMVIFGLGLT